MHGGRVSSNDGLAQEILGGKDGFDPAYRGTSLIRNRAPLGPYGRNMPRALWWS